jgi:peptidyl-prolyl cis-trans isomerase SurA
VGQLSPVVETAFGYHIIRVDQRRPGEVKARHILIKPVIDSSDVARTRTLADSVAQAWRNGASFDTLTRRFHDFANREETSLLQPYPIDSLPESYQTALRDKQPRHIDVFQIASRDPNVPKFVVIQLNSYDAGGEMRLEDLRERIRDQLAQESGIRRLIDQLRKETFVAMRLDELPMTPPTTPP